MNSRSLAEKLVRIHGTRDPFRIADALGVIVIDTPLKGIRGLYQYVHRCHIIYLDNSLDEQRRRWVCAHEIGHALLHKGLNRLFMDAHTHMVSNRYEIEADHFAADLLFSEEDIHPYRSYSIDIAARCMGLSEELAAYRLNR